METVKDFIQKATSLFEENNYEKSLFVAQTLIECGCCCRCSLRFLGCNVQELYALDEKVLLLEFRSLIEKDLSKMLVKNDSICIACIGSLQYAEKYAQRVFESLVAETFQVNSISLSCTLPVSTMIRNHLIRIHLEEKGYGYAKMDEEGFIKEPKNIFKNFLGDYIEKNSDFVVNNDAGFRMTVVLDHEASSQEHMILARLEKPLLNIRTVRQKRRRVIAGDSRQCIGHALKKLNSEEAKKMTPIPPLAPTEESTVGAVTFTNTSTYVGGRYLKFSREYSQTPWNVRGAKLTENSVSECFELIKIRHKADDAKFCTAGREDANVRMLGSGRPFFLELVNPRITRLSDQEYKDLEDEINKSTLHKDSVQVRHLTYIEP
ncbi:unnamed protein product [Rhizopus stolonifer]